MSAILTTFGVNWQLLLINAVNFGVLLLALWYFLYAPVTKMLEERRQKVAQGVHDAEAAQARLHEIESSRAGLLEKAGHEADEVLARAREAGTLKQKELTAQGEEAAAAVLKEAQLQAAEMKNQALEESKQEIAKLVVLGIEKTSASQ